MLKNIKDLYDLCIVWKKNKDKKIMLNAGMELP